MTKLSHIRLLKGEKKWQNEGLKEEEIAILFGLSENKKNRSRPTSDTAANSSSKLPHRGCK